MTNTALDLAKQHEVSLKKKLNQLGIFSFRDYFISCFYDELPQSEMTEEKITAAINYLNS